MKQTAIPTNVPSLTPREIVQKLDQYIVGQQTAKRAVAIALRQRWRRQKVALPLRDEITPKNIILIGATGVGKTEIARRLAKLAQAPFIKVEASKFTEVGYVGRDVDSIIRDLVEQAIQLIKQEAMLKVQQQTERAVEERILDVLQSNVGPAYQRDQVASNGELASQQREELRRQLQEGQLDDKLIELELTSSKPTPPMMIGQANMEEMGQQLQEMMQSLMGGQKQRKRITVLEARTTLQEEESNKLIDTEAVRREAIVRTENSGIVFVDEIDKIGRKTGGNTPDISREGVQRDILPLVEGTTVHTKHGPVQTDHILFIAAGAFHVSKVSDLIPELQGRFPIRVTLDNLGQEELLRILQEPQNSLPAQYQALLATEGVHITFAPDGLEAIARIAATANQRNENIGARRLHTVFERLLEEISYHAPDSNGVHIAINQNYVENTMGDYLKGEDLNKYIL